MSSKLESLAGNVDQIMQSFVLLNEKLTRGRRGDLEIVINMESCVRSAGKLVSSAATVVSSRSQKGSQFGSEFGDDLSDEQKNQIISWIPGPAISEELEDDISLTAVSLSTPTPTTRIVPRKPVAALTKELGQVSLEQEMPDIDYDLIDSWMALAKKNLADKKYAEVEQVMQQMFTKANVSFKSTWKWKHDSLRMLAEVYCRREMWTEADQVLQEDFNDREKTIESLAQEFCLAGKLTSAKHMLKWDFQGRTKIMELFAKHAYWHQSWEEAEETLLSLLSSEGGGNLRTFHLMHELAEVNWAKGNIETAREWCGKAMRGRKSLLGKDHVLYYQSVNLLVLLLDYGNETVEADGYRGLLPDDFKGMTLAMAR
jgi:hypothetical protein